MLSDIKILIIYNPKAGKGKIKSIMPEVKRMYTKAGLNPLFHATKRRDDAYETAGKFVKKYYGNTVVSDRKNSLYVIAAGGDGTLNEVMRGVLDTGYDVPIGIMPAGSTNDFGYSLGLNGGLIDAAEKAMNAILMDECFKCDVATFNGKYITYTAAFGLFSDVSYATPQKLKNTFGHAAYLMYGAKNILKTRKVHAEIKYKGLDAQDGFAIISDNEDKKIDADLLLGMVVSAKSVGGFRGITGSGVALDDGEDELMFVIWPKNPLKLIKTLVHAVGMVRKSPKALKQAYDLTVDHGIKMAKIKEARFTFDKPTAWSLDGEESEAQNEAEIKVIKQAVSYLVL